ncbi:MAG: hypothetical protein WB798_08005 [Nocardioidaceae bacterium]
MTDLPVPALPWLRSLTLAAVVIGSAVVAHAGAGGGAPPPPVVVALLVATNLVAAPLVAASVSTCRLAVLLSGAQLAVHVALALTGQAAAHATGHPAPMMHHGAAAPGASLDVSAVTSVRLDMLAAHLLASLAVGLWLAGVERAAWTVLSSAVAPGVVVLQLLASTLAVLTRPATTPAAGPELPRRAVARWSVAGAPRGRAIRRRPHRRGPPRSFAF